jgi:predicted phage baseplate assembly protein
VAFNEFKQQLDEILNAPPSPPAGVTDPSKFVTRLLLAQNVQPATSLQLGRSLGAAFSVNADANAQMLVKFAPRLSTTFYKAWANATVNSAPSSLKGIFALGVEAPLFGTSVPNIVTYDSNNKVSPPNQWQPWPIDSSDKDGTSLFLDQAYDAVQAGYVVIQSNTVFSVKQATTVLTVQRAAYGINGKTTQLTLAEAWNIGIFGAIDDLSSLRPVLVHAQSEEFTLVEQDISDVDVQGQEIPLDNLYDALTSGRWVIASGERTDITGVTGVKASELLMIAGLRQDFDPTLPGDKTRTTLLLATPMAYSYKRETVTICANVVKATHGESRNETLGNGDGSQSLQSFALKQPPLTFVSSPTRPGVDSTLEIFVNDVQWHKADTLAGLGPKDRKFITKTDDDDKTTVIFGNGEQGARLPTGMANVKAKYRNGIGKPGNAKAEQISLLQTRPLGVRSVINPLPASGGADKENRDQARENVPLAVMSLDRLVSVQDYADFTRTFAGIGKASAARLSDGRRQLVHVTIAGADDIPIDQTSDLYQNLLIALRRFGDPDLPVQVDLRELIVLVLSANVRLATDYQWEPVVTKIRAALLEDFGFQKRALGQPALLSEVISVFQNIPGVEYVDVDAFGGIPEKTAEFDAKGTPTDKRRLLTLDELAAAVQQIVNPQEFPGPATRVDVNLADFEIGSATLHPAQLAIFTDAVPDTLILNQIK